MVDQEMDMKELDGDGDGDRDQDNLEAEIDELVKPKNPKKRHRLKGGKIRKVSGENRPPRRIKQKDADELFPRLGVEHDEQKRLAKIATSISGLASQLAQK